MIDDQRKEQTITFADTAKFVATVIYAKFRLVSVRKIKFWRLICAFFPHCADEFGGLSQRRCDDKVPELNKLIEMSFLSRVLDSRIFFLSFLFVIFLFFAEEIPNLLEWKLTEKKRAENETKNKVCGQFSEIVVF